MRALLKFAVLSAFLLTESGAVSAAAADCNSLDACLANLRVLAKTDHNFGSQTLPEEVALNKKLISFDGAVPQLVRLLADPNENVANIAAEALRGASYIDPTYLPQIKAGLDRGLGWLAPALAHIPGDDAAREAVDRLLASESAPYNQEAYAVQVLGRRAIPFIVEAASCRRPCGPEAHEWLAHVLSEMGSERALAAPGLIAIAQNPSTAHEVAANVIEMIGALQEDGRSVEPQLLAFHDHDLSLTDAIDNALIGIRSDRAGGIIAKRLQAHPNIGDIRDVAELGSIGRTAGPELLRLLSDPDWDIRVASARALGYIQYLPALDALMNALNQTADVRLTFVAAESLGRLKATVARSALKHVATEHWYPYARQAAALALQHIMDGTSYPSVFPRQKFGFEFFDYSVSDEDVALCKSPLVTPKRESSELKLDQSTGSGKQLKKLAYPTISYSWGADVEPQPVSNREDKITVVTTANLTEHKTTKTRVPHIALRVDHGWLVGSDRGEFGGELMFLDDKGGSQKILNSNVEDIYRLGNSIIVLSGLAHLTMNDGMIYQIARGKGGAWSATPWRALPGAPQSSWMVNTGEVLVNVYAGGTILISADGSMRMAPCANSK